MPLLPFERGVDKTLIPLRDKIELFGPSGIPLIIPYGSKGEQVKGSPWIKYMDGWNRRTREDTLAPEYQADLYSEIKKNVAIRQGAKLTGLIGFDFDTNNESVIQKFFTANPWAIENALITIGSKGFTLWLEIADHYPALRKGDIWDNGEPPKIKDENGQEIKNPKYENIEYRGNGYSVIHGQHPAREKDYQCWVFGTGRQRIAWGKLVCPGPEFKWIRQFEDEQKPKRNLHPLPSDILKKRMDWIEENYQLLSWEDANCKARVVCPSEAGHSNDTGEGQTIIWTGADGSTPNFHCSHNHCKETNEFETQKIQNAFMSLETIVFYQDAPRWAKELKVLYDKMVLKGEFFCRNEKFPFSACYWKAHFGEPLPLNPDTFNNQLGEAEISFAKMAIYKKKTVLRKCLASREEIKRILAANEIKNLPLVTQIVRSPLLVKTEGGARILTQVYSEELKSIVLGDSTELAQMEMSLPEARALLAEVTGIWQWKSAADLSRAYAELFTPALLAGGFIERPVPAFLATADNFHAGKTLWHKAVGWIYHEEVDSHVLNEATRIGGFEEQINFALGQGAPFFLIDELDGKIKSAFVNALLTGANRKTVRSAYSPMVEVVIDRFILLLAGVKGFSIEDQLASRLIPIRLLKNPLAAAKTNYQWITKSGELVKPYLQKNQLRILGAIYTVILEWERLGYPLSPPDSRFPSWNMACDEILTTILKSPRTGDGLEEIQGDLANNTIGWWEDVFSKLAETNYLWRREREAVRFSLSALRDILLEEGLGIPGAKTGLRDQQADWDQKNALAGAICKLTKGEENEAGTTVFRAGNNFVIRYRCGNRSNGKKNYNYVLSTVGEIPCNTVEYEGSL